MPAAKKQPVKKAVKSNKMFPESGKLEKPIKEKNEKPPRGYEYKQFLVKKTVQKA
jgi:hypothetical protein